MCWQAPANSRDQLDLASTIFTCDVKHFRLIQDCQLDCLAAFFNNLSCRSMKKLAQVGGLCGCCSKLNCLRSQVVRIVCIPFDISKRLQRSQDDIDRALG